MATITNTAEGGANTTAATAANTGSTSGTEFVNVVANGSTAVTFSNEQAAHGSLSYKFTTNAQDTQYVEWTPTASAACAFRVYIYMASLPTAGNGFIRILTAGGGTTLAHILITNGNMQVQNAAGANVGTTSIAPPTGQWLRVEGSISNGNTSTGTLNLDVYTGDGNTPISGLSLALTAQNFGTANIGRIRFGRTAAFGTWAPFYLDDLAFKDSSTVYVGVSANTPPSVDAGVNQNVAASSTVNLHGTATDPDGSIAEVEWTVVAPSTGTPTITDDDALDASFTAGSAGNLYTVQLEATDNDGASVSDTLEVRVPVASGTSMRPLALNGTGSTWTIGGGSGSHGEALADDSDSTYVESPAVSSTPVALKVRHQPSLAKATGALKEKFWTDSGTANVVVKLYEGNTVRQTWSATAIDDTPTEYTYNLDSGTVAAITDWGNLYVEASVTE